MVTSRDEVGRIDPLRRAARHVVQWRYLDALHVHFSPMAYLGLGPRSGVPFADMTSFSFNIVTQFGT